MGEWRYVPGGVVHFFPSTDALALCSVGWAMDYPNRIPKTWAMTAPDDGSHRCKNCLRIEKARKEASGE